MGIIAVGTGMDFSVILRSDGLAFACGYNRSSRLGDGTGNHQLHPVQVKIPARINHIYVGGKNSAALDENGKLWTWGHRWGDTSADESMGQDWIGAPVQRDFFDDIQSVVAEQTHLVILRQDGTVWEAWKADTFSEVSEPRQVLPLSDVIAVTFNLALMRDGTVWSWGTNTSGQLGREIGITVGGYNPTRYPPERISALDSVTKIASAYGHGLALKVDGTVWAWGANARGQLGTGNTEGSFVPQRVIDLTSVTDIIAGSGYSFAICKDGSLWGWGWNKDGRLGDGTTTDRHHPVKVLNLTNPTSIATDEHTLAIAADGRLWAWGPNQYGQLFDGTTSNRHAPLEVRPVF